MISIPLSFRLFLSIYSSNAKAEQWIGNLSRMRRYAHGAEGEHVCRLNGIEIIQCHVYTIFHLVCNANGTQNMNPNVVSS